MSPFVPAGDQARWRVLYELIRKKPADETITYEELGGAIDLHPADERHGIQMAMRRASKELEVNDHRATEAVPNVGYRIVTPEEHLRLAKGQQRKASGALVRGKSKVVNVDLNGVDPEVRKAFEVVAHAFTMQMDMIRRTNIRQSNLEQVMQEISERTDRSDKEIADLRARLERLEKGE